jgi:hypothetical protein
VSHIDIYREREDIISRKYDFLKKLNERQEVPGRAREICVGP